jgi:methylmalonyl-CoA mutase
MKQDWLNQIRKELKDRQLDDLFWKIGDDISVNPFAHRTDFLEKMPEPLADFSTQKNDWEICEKIDADDPNLANRLALNALEGGAESLEFVFGKNARFDFNALLDGIFLAFVSVHFSEKSSQLTAKSFFEKLNASKILEKYPLENWRGSIDLSGEITAEMTNFSEKTNGQFRVLKLISDENLSPDDQLFDLINRANQLFEKFEKSNISPEKIMRAIQFEISVGTDYLTEIAKIRAFKILWLHVLRAWKIEKIEFPIIHATFNLSSISEDANANFIRASTQAMSAVIGGCHRLTVTAAGDDPIFHTRIARNVQHLMKLESGFDRVKDPAAGSYFLEKLTEQIANSVWEKLA